jgi:uncharacterized membrane protein
MDTRITKILFYSFLLSFFLSSCYYDNEEDLYPFDSSQSCDTLNMSYTNDIKPILEASCVSCHTTSGPSGGVVLDTYQQVKIVADNGRLWGSVNHESGYSAMPQGGSKLGDCDLNKIKAWINDGSPE